MPSKVAVRGLKSCKARYCVLDRSAYAVECGGVRTYSYIFVGLTRRVKAVRNISMRLYRKQGDKKKKLGGPHGRAYVLELVKSLYASDGVGNQIMTFAPVLE